MATIFNLVFGAVGPVAPFISDIYAKFVEPGSALRLCTIVCLATALACFVVSEIARNYSQVDKLWSILPSVYAWIFVVQGGWHPRLILMASLSTIWSLRLTFNFARRGGYTWPPWEGEEDYRWAVLRKIWPLNTTVGWLLFNVGFVCLYQNLLLLLMVVPSAVVIEHGKDVPLNAWDAALAVLFVLLVVIESLADNAQYAYQTEKYRLLAENKLHGIFQVGFPHTGLFAWCRHPNYTAEQMIWITYYLFSEVATQTVDPNWSALGCVLLVLLFQGSANFSEGISSKKYSAYAHYQDAVPKFIPWLGKVDTSSLASKTD